MTARKPRVAPAKIELPSEAFEELRPAVAAPSTMNDEIFVKHFNTRHLGPGQYEGAAVDIVGSWPDQIATFRAYHNHSHNGTLAHKPNHTHVQGSQPWQDPTEVNQ